MSTQSEVVESKAVPIESDIDIVSAFDKKVSAWEQVAADEAELHEATEITSSEGYEAALAARKSARRVKRKIESERTEFLRPVKSAVSAMESRVRDAIAPLKALDEALSCEIADWEKRAKKQRELMLADAYVEFAPMLADMAPYERLASVFDPDGSWTSDKIDDEQARELMEYAVKKVSDGYEFICMQQCAPGELEELKTEFFLCLDANAAISRIVEARRQREAVAAFEAERAAQQTPVQPLDTGSVVTPSEFEDLQASLGTNSYAPPQPQPAQPASKSEVPPYALFAYVTEAQRPQMVAFCKQHGIHGSFKPTHGRRMALVLREG